jgi:large subunit ribosomal protein L3
MRCERIGTCPTQWRRIVVLLLNSGDDILVAARNGLGASKTFPKAVTSSLRASDLQLDSIKPLLVAQSIAMPPRPSLNVLLSPLFLQLPASIRTTIPQHTQRRTIKSILKPPPKPNRFDQSARNGAPEALSRKKVLERKSYTIPHRTGLLATKKGHVSIYDPETGRRMPATVLQVDRCQVISHKTMDKHGYWAVQVGSGYRRPDNLTRPELGHLARQEIGPKDEIVEFRVKGASGVEVKVGSELRPDWFAVGQCVDCRSKNKGKGFAGVC